MTNRVFLDASFWITYRSEKEARQPDAQRILTALFKERARFVTTLPVFCEIQAAFSRNPRKRMMVVEDLWNNPLVAIEEVSHQDQAAAIELLANSRDKSYSLCDAISFVVMRRLELKQALAFDEHFRQFGGLEVLA